jgi:hypothetical protein
MYELKKKIKKVFMSKFVWTGPIVLWKKDLPGRGLTKVEKHCFKLWIPVRIKPDPLLKNLEWQQLYSVLTLQRQSLHTVLSNFRLGHLKLKLPRLLNLNPSVIDGLNM